MIIRIINKNLKKKITVKKGKDNCFFGFPSEQEFQIFIHLGPHKTCT